MRQIVETGNHVVSSVIIDPSSTDFRAPYEAVASLSVNAFDAAPIGSVAFAAVSA
jgi:hypothetical protein